MEGYCGVLWHSQHDDAGKRMIKMKTLIVNGIIIDGTGKPGYPGMLAVEGERIQAVGLPADPGYFDQVVDAGGMAVAPGFIDTHSHSDVQVLLNPFIEAKIRQGVTTEILGQDGISTAPLPKRYISDWRKILASFDGDSDEIDWSYETTDGYLRQMEKNGLGLNEAYLVPHGNVHMAVMGLDNRIPSTGEMEQMCLILEREMQAGAFGFSTGLMYSPCVFAKTEELVELCKVVAKYDGVFAVHQRSEANDILQSMQEVLDIGRKSGVKVHFSHFKVCGSKNWGLLGAMLELLDQAQTEGIRVSFDQYPYSAGSTILGAVLPPWAHEGGTEKLLERLQKPDLRRQMIRDIERGIPGWDNIIEFAGLEKIFIAGIASKTNQDLTGKNLAEIGRIRDKDPYDAIFDLLYEERNTVHIVDFYGTEDHVIRLLNRPEQNVCTDGLFGERPHPRIFGSYPRVLGKYVREEKTISLEAAIRKMTGKAAETFGIRQRGLLREEYFADIVVFDPGTIKDRGTFSDPIHYPEGIQYVLINGNIVVSQGEYRKFLAGKVLRK